MLTAKTRSMLFEFESSFLVHEIKDLHQESKKHVCASIMEHR